MDQEQKISVRQEEIAHGLSSGKASYTNSVAVATATEDAEPHFGPADAAKPSISSDAHPTAGIVNSHKAVLQSNINKEAGAAEPLDCAEEEESRSTWLRIASEETLRKLWDTPEEEEAWRDL